VVENEKVERKVVLELVEVSELIEADETFERNGCEGGAADPCSVDLSAGSTSLHGRGRKSYQINIEMGLSQNTEGSGWWKIKNKNKKRA
jgi:hypothetical protein